MNNNNNKNKVVFIWVIVTLLITVSMAFADVHAATNTMTVSDVNRQKSLEQQQDQLDFPVLENWPAGQGENDVWVDPRQTMNPIGMDGLELNTPKYRMSLDSGQPINKLTDSARPEKSVSRLELFSWD